MPSRRRNAIQLASASVCLLCVSLTTRATFWRSDTTEFGCSSQKPCHWRYSEAEHTTPSNGRREWTCSIRSLLQLPDYMQQHILQPILQPSPNTIIAAIVLFALGMVAMYEMDEEEKEVRSKILVVASIGACILGISLGGDAKQIVLVYVPWSMLLATALHRIISRDRKRERNDVGTELEKASKQ